MCPHLLLFEPLSECMVIGATGAWAAFYLFRCAPISFFLIHVLVWFLMDWALLHVVQNGALPFNKFEFLVSGNLKFVSSVNFKERVAAFKVCGESALIVHTGCNTNYGF